MCIVVAAKIVLTYKVFFFIIGDFFQVLYHPFELVLPPRSHASVIGTSRGCSFPFSMLQRGREAYITW